VRRADAPVIVVGAGPAGLSSAGALVHAGVDPVVLEQDDEIGARWANRYDRLHLHTVRRFSGLAHYPLPRHLPRYVSKDDFAAYLRDYAARFALDVRLGEAVTGVRPTAGAWEVMTPTGVWTAQAVVLATGFHDRPVVPAWPGRDEYEGLLFHAADYRSAGTLAGRSVLVVGIGNSGAEIAAELAEAAPVTIAVRRPPPITKRELLGIPVHVLGVALAGLPPGAVDAVGSRLRRLTTGDLSAHGLGAPAWTPFTARRPPLIDVGFLEQLKRGRIAVRPAVERLTQEGVAFADGRAERFDAVVAATGYRSGLPELLDGDGVLDDRGRPRTVDGLRVASHPGLYASGFRDSIRGALFEIARDSRRLAPMIAAALAGTGTESSRAPGRP
jgi:cation diffusion facilitator CzcD-associated flavoprotein CzcO